MPERLISADSHVKMEHEQVKAHLPTRLHEAYDEAAGAYEAGMKVGAGAANRAGATQKRTDQVAASNSVFTRPGYWDPVERLEDMDADGVEAEVLYCEVSAFRYLYLIEDGWQEATRGVQRRMLESSRPPTRGASSSRTRSRSTTSTPRSRGGAGGVGRLQVAAAPGVPRRARARPTTATTRYDPLFSAIQETGLPICCHIGLNTSARRPRAARPDAAARGSSCRWSPLLGGRGVRHVDHGRRVRALPAAARSCSSSPGSAGSAWWLDIVDDMVQRQGYEFPAITELPSDYFHRNVFLTFIDEGLGLHRMRDVIGVENIMWSTDYPHPVTSWPNSRKIVEEQFDGIPADERERTPSGNAARIWSL